MSFVLPDSLPGGGMHVVFIHQNFPAQFGHIAARHVGSMGPHEPPRHARANGQASQPPLAGTAVNLQYPPRARPPSPQA